MDCLYNILMYSHDSYGLGHIRRTMAIASYLRDPNTNILILTGSPIVGRFPLPEQIDFVRIPGMIKKTNEEYLSQSIKINPEHALDIRKNLIRATVQTFRPQLFIVDKEPMGLKREVLPTLEWIHEHLPETRTVLGLRDIMDEASVIKQDWAEKGVYRIMDELYDEIWVYGVRDFYNPIEQYDIPDHINCKMTFTGYIPRKIPGRGAVNRVRRKHGIRGGEKLVVVTTGGGGDGYGIMDVYLKMLEAEPRRLPFKSVLITGPFMPRKQRDEITERSRRLGISTWHFFRRMEEILAAADLVVSMGGYNTVCEILSQGSLSLIIPREIPRKEQLIRARTFKEQLLADYIPWQEFGPESLKKKILTLLYCPDEYLDAISRFKMTGLNIMGQRLQACRELMV